jgi:hypothetical protein
LVAISSVADLQYRKVIPGATSTPFNSARNGNGIIALPTVHQRAVLFLAKVDVGQMQKAV